MTIVKKAALASIRKHVYDEMVAMVTRTGFCMLDCVTGFGKTIAFTNYSKQFANERILYITERKNQVDNMRNRLRSANNESNAETYTWLSISKEFDNRLPELKNYDTLIFDEAHRMGAHNCDKIVDMAKSCGIKVLGGTATPLRPDEIHVGHKLFGGNMVTYQIGQAYADGFINIPKPTTIRYLKIRINALQENLKNKPNSKWAVSKLTNMERAIAERDNITEAIHASVDVSGPGIYIVFHPNITALEQMAKTINLGFKKYNDEKPGSVKFFKVTSHNEHDDVEDFIAQHEGFSVIHSVRMMTTGYHFDDIAGLIFNSITGSPVQSAQEIGRLIELGSERALSITDIIGRFSDKRNAWIEYTKDMGQAGNKRTKGTGLTEDAELYAVDSQLQDIEFEQIIESLELWAKREWPLSLEKATEYRRLYNLSMGSAVDGTGLSESIIKEYWSENISTDNTNVDNFNESAQFI